LEATSLAAETRDGFYLPLALFYLGLTRANRGRISAAMASLDEALDLAKRNNSAVALSQVPNGCGWLWREIGNLDKAIEFNNGSVELSRRLRAAEAEANGSINLVYDYCWRDRRERPPRPLKASNHCTSGNAGTGGAFTRSGTRLPKPSCGMPRANQIALPNTLGCYSTTPAGTVCPNILPLRGVC
jgi:hypothetical protein